MGYLDAELDLGPIDKVDVRNELRPFTVLRAPEANFPKCCFLLQTEGLPIHYIVRVFVNRPGRPAVTLFHARLSRSNGWGTCMCNDSLKLGESTFLNTLSRASEDVARYPN